MDISKFQKKYWILDVDDCLYPIDSGLHSYIKQNIITIFNRFADHDPEAEKIVFSLEAYLKKIEAEIKSPFSSCACQ